MEFIRDLSQLRHRHRGCVATIGNFDGVHRGHQTVLQQLVSKGQELQLPNVVVIFEPQPEEFFAPAKAPIRLTRLREKLIAIQRYGNIDRVLCVRFNSEIANLPAEECIRQLIVKGLDVKHLVIGDDFRFGKGRAGDFEMLQQAGQHYGFTVESQHTFLLDNERVSSTRIRRAMAQGDMQIVQELLGRPFTLSGRIGYGKQLGHVLGFPTANINLHRVISPLNGVFAVIMHSVKLPPLAGIANLGFRPTVDGKHLLLEVHLFDFNQSIYGYHVEIEFLEKIRDEQRFVSLEALKHQIEQDIVKARQLPVFTASIVP